MRSKNKGMAIPLALGLIVVFGIVIFAFQRFSSSTRLLVIKGTERDVIINACDYFANMLQSYVIKRSKGHGAKLADGKWEFPNADPNLIYQDLVYSNAADLKADFTSSLDQSSLQKHFPEFHKYISDRNIVVDHLGILYHSIEQIYSRNAEILPDNYERTGKITITMRAKLLKTKMQVELDKEFRVVHLVPPVVSKFTLFVRQPPYSDDLNCVVNDDKGNVIGNNVPIICYNKGKTFISSGLNSVKETGLIFLGGNTWRMSIAAGKSGPFGEEFLLSPEWGFYTRSGVPFLNTHDVIWSQTGFHKDLSTSTTLWDNADWFHWYGKTNVRNTSAIHLYGDNANVSPTLVIGDVRPRFGIYSAVIWKGAPITGANAYTMPFCPTDTDFRQGNSLFNKSIAPNPQVSANHQHIMNMNEKQPGASSFCANMAATSTPTACRMFLYNTLPQDPVEMQYAKDNNTCYEENMCQIVNGTRLGDKYPIHYNSFYDRLVGKDGSFFPKFDLLSINNVKNTITARTTGTTPPDDYFYSQPVDSIDKTQLNGQVQITRDGNTIIFDGELASIEDILNQDKTSHIVPLFDNQTQFNDSLFKQFFIKDKKLNLNYISILSSFGSATNSIPEISLNDASTPLQIDKGGWIIFDNSIKINAGISNSSDDELLVICSLNRDIIINTSEPIHACLIALKGRIIKTCPGPMSIVGNVAVNTIDKSCFESTQPRSDNCYIHNTVGCTESFICYDDKRLNVTAMTDPVWKSFYRIYISSDNTFVKFGSY